MYFNRFVSRDELERRYRKEVLEELRKVVVRLDKLIDLTEHPPKPKVVPTGIVFVFGSTTNDTTNKQGDNMAELVIAQGKSAPVELHYVDGQGNDLGLVPASDSPSITTDQPAELGVSISGSSGTLTNSNTGTGDVDVNLLGSAKGFTTSAVVTCQGAGAGQPVPAGVKFVFPQPTV